eukprot:TRINITY_DN6816_c0_g1_i1.p1 TRINITY_DN6816_c0_g1~~TRINITY_DN6816_c0_g1_i1.p1  ORF type:complete len:139 (+),score=33.09 TRINITY_DN6816_c0_g1_i1:177-593(+)
MEGEAFMELLQKFPRVRNRDYIQSEAEYSALCNRSPAANFSPFDAMGSITRALTAFTPKPRALASPMLTSGSQEPAADALSSFLEVLQNVAATKLCAEDAVRFTEAFRHCHHELIFETLSLDGIERICNHLLQSEQKQ